MDKENNKNNIFIIDDLTTLYKDGKFLHFIPTSDMTRIEQLNSVIRFFLYYLVIIFAFQFKKTYVYVPFIGILFIVVLYYIYLYDPKSKVKELYRQKNHESFNDDLLSHADSDVIIESGYYDSNGKLHTGPEYTAETKRKNNIDYSYNELLEYQKNICRKPTKDNPFMNPPITDFNNKFKPEACNADDADIKESIEQNFNVDLYRNVDDLLNVKNSQRQFYTMPTTAIPPDQPSFARWLYGTLNTCKTDQEQCLRYEDLRFKREF